MRGRSIRRMRAHLCLARLGLQGPWRLGWWVLYYVIMVVLGVVASVITRVVLQ